MIRNKFPSVIRNLRSIKKSMRGYNKLIKSNNLNKVHSLRNKLSNTKLTKNINFDNKYLFQNLNNDIEISLRQYLLNRLLDLSFNKKILGYLNDYSNNSLIILPYEWRKKLNKEGFKVNSIFNKFYWNIYVLFLFAYGFYENLKKIIIIPFNIFFNKYIDKIKESVWFIGLEKDNLSNSTKAKNIINWHHNNIGHKNKVKYYSHDVYSFDNLKLKNYTLIKNYSNIPLPSDFKTYFKFIFWFVKSFFLTLIEFLNSNYAPLILYNELSLNFLILIQKGNLPKSFYFSQIKYLYKPLWTYSYESFNGKVFLYFYATNIYCIDFKKRNKIQLSNFWHLIKWKNYCVWDVYQKKFILKNIDFKAQVNVYGPIYFSDSNLDAKISFDNYVVVFDTQPFRSSFHHLLLEEQHHISSVVNKFNNDIYKMSKTFNFNIVHKRKRKIEHLNLQNKSYIKNLKNLSNKNNFHSIDPLNSPYDIIEKSNIVISMPYSSISIYAKLRGIKTIYYDPFSNIIDNKNKNHGVELISGYKNLKLFFNKFYFKNDESKYL